MSQRCSASAAPSQPLSAALHGGVNHQRNVVPAGGGTGIPTRPWRCEQHAGAGQHVSLPSSHEGSRHTQATAEDLRRQTHRALRPACSRTAHGAYPRPWSGASRWLQRTGPCPAATKAYLWNSIECGRSRRSLITEQGEGNCKRNAGPCTPAMQHDWAAVCNARPPALAASIERPGCRRSRARARQAHLSAVHPGVLQQLAARVGAMRAPEARGVQDGGQQGLRSDADGQRRTGPRGGGRRQYARRRAVHRPDPGRRPVALPAPVVGRPRSAAVHARVPAPARERAPLGERAVL